MKTNSHMEQQSTAERLTSMLSKIAIQPCAIENQKKKRSWTFFLEKVKCFTAFRYKWITVVLKRCPGQHIKFFRSKRACLFGTAKISQ